MHRGQQHSSGSALSDFEVEYQAVQDLSDDELRELFVTRIVVAGSRGFKDYETFIENLELTLDLPLLLAHEACFISGMASSGPDEMIVRYCKERQILCRECPADWDNLGKRAGYVRNAEMAKLATHAIIFWDAISKGTAHMVKECKRVLGGQDTVYICDSDDTLPSNVKNLQLARHRASYALANQDMLAWSPDTD